MIIINNNNNNLFIVLNSQEFRRRLFKCPAAQLGHRWTSYNNVYSIVFFRVAKDLATEPFQWLDLASGMSCRGGSDTVLVSPPSRH